ncbi:MAG TPA: Do family serine endopeptidase [Gemmatimonadota bacterium]|nr:Do family serine endopeptidase [Gemmatimonadota bacterium]
MHPIKTKLTVLIVGLASLGLGVLFASTLDWTPASHATQTGQTVPTTEASLRAMGNAFTRIAQEVTPAVVYVSNAQLVEGRALPFDFGPFEDFFEFRGPRNGPPEPERFRRQSGGSGVIIREDGYIVTNNHVVEGAERLQVVLNNRRAFDAQVVGRDPSTDLAVIKIDAEDLPVARFTEIDQVQVGEWVLALGNPFGLEFTMTAGIVSAIGRGSLGIINRGDNPYAIEDFIQTDAAINPGNSGGPLVNIEGEVIGINTAIASRTGGYQGYGFAIPVSIVRPVVDELIETGQVRRAVLGVSIQLITPDMQEALGLPTLDGVLIADFDGNVANNPARRAGLEAGDVVLSVDGEEVSNPSELQQAIAFHEPSDEVELTIWRDGRRQEVDVELGERPSGDDDQELAVDSARESESALGMEVQAQTARSRAALAQRAQIDPSEIPTGVFVRDVAPLSAADEAGIPENTIITQIGERRIASLEDYRSAVEGLEPGSVVYLRVYVPGFEGQQFRALRVPR